MRRAGRGLAMMVAGIAHMEEYGLPPAEIVGMSGAAAGGYLRRAPEDIGRKSRRSVYD